MHRQLDATLYTPGEAASLFRVDPKTITRWAKAGRFDHLKTTAGVPVPLERSPVIRTGGGHLRLDAKIIDGLVSGRIVFAGA